MWFFWMSIRAILNRINDIINVMISATNQCFAAKQPARNPNRWLPMIAIFNLFFVIEWLRYRAFFSTSSRLPWVANASRSHY